ncbi:NFX1-type zinc finger-containing protein 1, partial [Armadillidium vulgare]
MMMDLHNPKTDIYDNKLEILKQKLMILKEIEKVKVSFQEYKALEAQSHIGPLDFYSRWMMYKFWKSELIKKFREKLSALEKKYMKLSDSRLSLKDLLYLDLMKKADVVGMTTTAAAQYCKILHDLAPPIVVVEEAAEILEAHVVTSLSEKCQHLILIGDHQQLRPKPNVFELAQHYHLDVSFFERMIKNGISYETLEYQHRMRPSISDLLVPTIYENLKDHESVLSHPKIKGVKKDLFFIDHNVYETEQLEETGSYENPHEAEFMMGLCLHLIRQGYDSYKVTIITPYLGQFLYFKQVQKRSEFEECSDVRIYILDNYQGEENDIILLSLVRSNEEKKIGFMKIDNRVNVALSRAKHAMYIIGNMSQMIDASDLWKKINKKLIDGGNIGTELELECSNHPSEIIKVKTMEDFFQKSPKGGCQLPCMTKLKCQHQCPFVCHPILVSSLCFNFYEMDHAYIRCTQSCKKIICDLGHQCPKLCSELCGECKVLVDRELPCGHTHPMECSISTLHFKCEVFVEKELRCGHTQIMKCSISTFRLKCEVLVEKELSCGHTHPVECSISTRLFKCPTVVKKELPICKHTFDVECHVDISKYKCKKPCTVLLECGHQCQKLCHLESDPYHKRYWCQFPCEKNLNCEFGHKCGKKCYEECGSCVIKINKVLTCGHNVNQVDCGRPEKETFCLQNCQRTLTCGHKCRLRCGAECGSCMVLVEKVITECKHTVEIPCDIPPSIEFCQNKCVKFLPCSHPCTEKCYQTCTEKCMVMLNADKCPREHF